jgi:hypothetical protein
MGLLDQMQPTPRNRMMGLLADALTAANDYANKPDKTMPGGMANPPLSMLSSLLSLPSLATTAQRASYGEPLTNAGRANTPFLKPETADAMMMAPLSPRTALGAVGLAAGMGDAGAMRAATVWHGSPHKFDKFDASKIGTGEGAQAYGHGLYLAESPDVAKGYSMMGDQNPTAQQYLRMWGGDRAKAEAAFLKDVQENAFGKHTQQIANDGDVLASIRGKGQVYKVDLPDEHIAKMLDWDKPLSQQAPAMAAMDRAGYKPNPSMTAGQFIQSKQGEGFAQYLSDDLRKQGIPGIRYMDGGSRGAGQGSSNFVIFPGNEGLLQILERNGAPLGK